MRFLDAVTLNPTIHLLKGKVYPFVEMANISSNNREPDLIEFKLFSSGVKFEDGDTVVARITPCLQNGKMFYCHDIGQGFGSTEYLVFRAKENISDSRYIYYLMQTDFIRQSMVLSMVGATGRQRVNNAVFDSLEISCPPLPTQRRIAGILSAYDDLIENNHKQIKLLEEAARRLYKEWFVDLHFPGHENTKIVDGLPEGWSRKKLGEIADVIMGQSPKSESYNLEKEGLPFHQGVGSFGYRFVVDEIYSNSCTRIADKGSILFSVRAPVGQINITTNRVIIGRGLSAINHKKGYQSFLYYLLNDKFFEPNLIGNGAIFASITKDDLLRQIFVVPTEGIIKQFENSAVKIDALIFDLYKQIKLLQEARDRLLPKLMSGEIEVR